MNREVIRGSFATGRREWALSFRAHAAVGLAGPNPAVRARSVPRVEGAAR
jgi:hypothetical protein